MSKELTGVEGVDYVCCCVCGKRFRAITYLHLKTHNITIEIYRNRYPDATLQCEGMILINKEKNSGKNNAVYNHDVDIFIEDNTNKHLCACGCGEYIKIVRNHYWMGIPRFIQNHGMRSDEVRNKLKISVEETVQDPKWRDEQSGRMLQYYEDNPDKTTKGYKQSEETVEKNREWHLGRKLTIITRERMSAGHQGIPYDEWEDFISDGDWRNWSKAIYLNEWFEGCHRHHITKTIVICVPPELHYHIRHNLKTGKGMAEMNILALQFINGCYND